MCRPPDPVVSSSAGREDRDDVAQFYRQANAANDGEWYDDEAKGYSPEHGGAWEWAGRPASSLNLVQQQPLQQTEAQAAIAGHGNFQTTAISENRHFTKPATFQRNLSSASSFPVHDKMSLKLQQLLEGESGSRKASGNSHQLMASQQGSGPQLELDQYTSLMAGPSFGLSNSAGIKRQSEMAVPLKSKSIPWPSSVKSDNLRHWLRTSDGHFAPHGSQPAVDDGMRHMAGMDLLQDSLDKNMTEHLENLPDHYEDGGTEDDEVVKEKKIRRMLSNRASAKRSRQRRQERLGDLEILTAKLKMENVAVTRKYNEAMEKVHCLQLENESMYNTMENLRVELEAVKRQKQSGGLGRLDSKNSVQSAGTAVNNAINDEDNEAQSKQEHDEFSACEQPELFSWDNISGQSLQQEGGRPAKLPQLSAEHLSKLCSQELAATADKPFLLAAQTPVSGVTPHSNQGGATMPGMMECEIDELGLPILCNDLLEPELLDKVALLGGDDWFTSLVQGLNN